MAGFTIRAVTLVVALVVIANSDVVLAGPDEAAATAGILRDLGFSLSAGGAERQTTLTVTRRGLLVPTPWGDFEATIVSTPTDRMVRLPLSPGPASSQPSVQPYVTAGSRRNVDSDSVLETVRPSAFADSGRTNLKAGAGVILKLDHNVEVFGEYHFMRLQRDTDGRGSPGPLGTSLDSTGFSLGISVRY